MRQVKTYHNLSLHFSSWQRQIPNKKAAKAAFLLSAFYRLAPRGVYDKKRFIILTRVNYQFRSAATAI